MRKIVQLVTVAMLIAGMALAQTPLTICQGDSIRLQAQTADLYEWLPHDGLDDPYSQTPLAGPSQTTAYRVRRLRTSGDLITNGNFSAGNTGFTSNYSEATDIMQEGLYSITDVARNAQSSFNTCTDHTGNTGGKMMVCNGAPVANQVVWSQVITVQPNTNYAFSSWVNGGVSTGAKAILQFSINSNLLGTAFATQYAPCDWQSFYATWNSGTSTQAVISIVNQNTTLEGNDFALDDIFFQSFTTDSTLATVTVKPALAAPFITITGDTTPCRGQTVGLAGPVNAVGYLWNDGLVQRTRTVDTGTYFLRVLGSNGCYSFRSDTISVKPQPYPGAPIISTLATGSLCPGDSAKLYVADRGSTAPGLTFKWSTTSVGDTIKVYGGGTYSARAVSTQGCESQSSNLVMIGSRTRPPQPRITFLGDSTFCQGDSVRLTSSYTQNNHWSTGSLSRAITVRTTGFYNVFFRAPAGCASLPRTVRVTVTGAGVRPVVTAAGATTLCSGDSVTLTSNVPTGNLWSTGARSQSIRVGQTGNYAVTSTTSCGTSTSTPLAVTVNQRPTAPAITVSGNITFCEGDSVRLTSNQVTGNIWSNGATTRSITIRQSTSVTIQLVANGCTSSVSQPIVVTANAKPGQPNILANGPLAFCDGGVVRLTGTGSGVRGVWSTNASTQEIDVRQSGSYTFTSISAQGCSSVVSAPIVVTVKPLPVTPIIVQRAPDTLATQQVYSRYEWFFNGSIVSTSPKFVPTLNGAYTVKGYSTDNCASILSATFNFARVSVKDALAFGINIYPNPSIGYVTITGLAKAEMEVYNTLGRLVFKQLVSAGEPVNLMKLSNGLYQIQLKGAAGIYSSALVLTR